MRIVPGNFIHAGCFRNEKSTGNYRIQLMITDKNIKHYEWSMHFTNYKNFKYVNEQDLSLYKFQTLSSYIISSQTSIRMSQPVSFSSQKEQTSSDNSNYASWNTLSSQSKVKNQVNSTP